jgi:hypothetical protein
MAERAALSRSLHVVCRSAVLVVAVLLAVPEYAKAGQAHDVQTASREFLPGALTAAAPDGAYRTMRGLDTRARDQMQHDAPHESHENPPVRRRRRRRAFRWDKAVTDMPPAGLRNPAFVVWREPYHEVHYRAG